MNNTKQTQVLLEWVCRIVNEVFFQWIIAALSGSSSSGQGKQYIGRLSFVRKIKVMP